MHGRIESGWRREGTKTVYAVIIPANTTAVVKLPAAAVSKVKEGGKSLDRATGCVVKGLRNGRVEIAVSAGSYVFEVSGAAGGSTAKSAKKPGKNAGVFDPPV